MLSRAETEVPGAIVTCRVTSWPTSQAVQQEVQNRTIIPGFASIEHLSYNTYDSTRMIIHLQEAAMTNETEKAMWSCKTSDTPWTLSRLLKKAICAVLPDSGPHTVHRVNKKENNYLTSVLSDICDSNEKDSNEAMFNPFHPLYRDHHPIDSREWSGSPYKTPE